MCEAAVFHVFIRYVYEHTHKPNAVIKGTNDTILRLFLFFFAKRHHKLQNTLNIKFLSLYKCLSLEENFY